MEWGSLRNQRKGAQKDNSRMINYTCSELLQRPHLPIQEMGASKEAVIFRMTVFSAS